MGAYEDKGHIAIDGYPFVLALMPRTGRHVFGRDEAPHFVSKVSSGDPNYRDSTFFPHWVQNNWLNGFDQEKWNDGGKFFRSAGVNPTEQEELTLQKKYNSLGQAESGVNVLTQLSWRAPAVSAFGTGIDGDLTISADTTDTPIDSACTGTIGSTTLSATNASFAVGQYIFIHQSQGTGTGNWMKNKILGYTAGTITLQDALNAEYVTGAQVLVMKQYSSITINSGKTWSCKAWNGTTGGILAFMCSGTMTVTGTISAVGATGIAQTGGVNSTGGGYRGGGGCVDPTTAAIQGESELGVGTQSKSANGSGGGGGQSTPIGGTAYQTDADLSTRFCFGGGGGGGKADRGTGPSGGNGGGIIFAMVKTATVTGAISADGGAGRANGSNDWGDGGGGGGGCIYIKANTATLGTGLVHAAGGLAGTGGSGGKGAGGAGSANGSNGDGAGGNGGVGRVHMDYAVSYTGTTSPTLDTAVDATLVDNPASSSATHILGYSNGKIRSSDGAGAYTELFDARKITWFEPTGDGYSIIGDDGGTEKAAAQSFQVPATMKVKAIQVKLKKSAGTPGNITVRIETNSSTTPSGTLANANATATLTAFTTDTDAIYTVEFPDSFTLTVSTTYWLVIKVAAGANDNNYSWTTLAAGGYASGNNATSTDGGSTWSAGTKDHYFRILGNTTSVNDSLISSITGTTKAYFAVGDPASIADGDARLVSYDGTTWAVAKVFNTTGESCALSLAEFGATPKLYVGLGGMAKVYSSSDGTTFTLSKRFTKPDNPGYVMTLQEYGGRLYAGGGYPELLYGNNTQYGGFMYSYDEYSWTYIPQFEYTVVVSARVYDNLLFIGTIKRHLYVYNTASMDKLFEFPWDVQIRSMYKWDDKLAIAIAPTPGKASEGEEGIYLFDRNGFHKAFYVTDREWYSVYVFNNNLVGGSDEGYAYVTNYDNYQASGTLQMSYFEASLPSIDKLWRSVVLQYEALETGCTIQVEYKTDESDSSWTNLGTASTVASTQKELTFPVAFYSKKLSLRITLATSVASSTPKLKVIDARYLISPDFKYLWKMKVACPDNLVWLDGTEPISTTTTIISYSDTTLDLLDASGFPTKGRAVIVDAGVEDEFTWTGRTGNQLTGVAGLSNHSDIALTVKITGAMLHKTLLVLKQTKQFYTYTDIDGLTYTTTFHQLQEDEFIVNQEDGIENNIPISLLEA